jgi:hypothetical protein
MIDIYVETLIRFDEAAKHAKVDISAIYRWALKGLPPRGSKNRIRLEAVCIGRKWHTSREALARFIERQTPVFDDNQVSTPENPRERKRASARAEKQLQALGI